MIITKQSIYLMDIGSHSVLYIIFLSFEVNGSPLPPLYHQGWGSSSSSAFPSSSWTSILPSQGIIGLQSPHFLYQDPNEGSGRVKRGGNCSRWTTGGYLLLPGYIVVVGDMELINSIRFLAHFRIFLRKQNKSQSPGEGEQSGEGVLA